MNDDTPLMNCPHRYIKAVVTQGPVLDRSWVECATCAHVLPEYTVLLNVTDKDEMATTEVTCTITWRWWALPALRLMGYAPDCKASWRVVRFILDHGMLTK